MIYTLHAYGCGWSYSQTIKVLLWRNLHLSYLSHFKTQTSILYEKKNAVFYFEISLFVQEIFKFFKIYKLAKWWPHKLNQILIKYDEKRYLCQFVSDMLDFLQYDSNQMCSTIWAYQFCYHGNILGLILMALLATFSILLFANGALSSKHKNMLGRVHGLVKVFFELKVTKILKSG